ncbi:MAG: DHH family phosphoesterase [Candidatus Cloacimonetes bacterium HGW-Cloacimonetes-1]|nr:MAG: DHH family phosphoesterase [Candidatus Cloacimonetes bacterium HGW-Cloacimonetes-1]
MEQLRTNLIQYSSEAGSIALMTHVNPDGDGFAACLGLHRILRHLGYDADIVMDAFEYARYMYLVEDLPIQIYHEQLQYDFVVVLDCNNIGRIGQRESLVQTAKHVIVIDHHVPDRDLIPCDYSYINTTHVSAGIIVFNTFEQDIKAMAAPDQLYVAKAIYTTILNDTNNFSNANTDAEVFAVSSELCKYGLLAHQMHQSYFMSYSPAELRFLGEALATIKPLYQGRILFMYSSLEMLHRNGLTGDTMSSLTRWVQGSKGVDVIVYYRETAPNDYRLSLRSIILNVNQIAVKHGGGGHRSASGCSITGSLEDIEKEVLNALVAQLKVWDEENRS